VTAISTEEARARSSLGHNLTLGLVGVLGHAIVAGEFPHGLLPTEPELERRFAVSRSVVREAVKMLAAKGLVATRPRQGTRIEPDTAWNLFDPLVLRWIVEGASRPALLRQLCQFSMSIEPAAAALAAQGGSAGDHARIAAACHRLAGSEGHPSASLDAAIGFHHAIVVASGNVFCLRTGDAVGAAHRVLARYGGWRRPAAFLHHYRAVTRAIEARAAERAGQEMTALLERVFEPAMGRPAAA
jgi:DNA-binding FadR family transcriptional regulator